MTAGLDGGATAAALGVSAGVTYDGALTLLSGKRKGGPLRPMFWLPFAPRGLRVMSWRCACATKQAVSHRCP